MNATESLKTQEKDLLDYVGKNEAMDPQKAEKLKGDEKVSLIDFLDQASIE